MSTADLFPNSASANASGGGSSTNDAGATAPIAANATNHPPTINGTAAVSVLSGQSYQFAPVAQDIDGQTLFFFIDGKPGWASFDVTSGTLSGTPTAADAGGYSNIRISVTDGIETTSLQSFAIQVLVPPAPLAPLAVNHAPTISGSPSSSVTAESRYSFTPTAADADGDSLKFVIDNQPYWISFDAGTGTIVGAPSAGDAGQYANISVGVDDGHQTSWLDPFSIRVTAAVSGLAGAATDPAASGTPAVNHAPVLSGTPPASVTAGSPYYFAPSSWDDDGDLLRFDIQNKPSWATFSSSDGSLNGTPASSSVGTTYGVTISVSDGKTSTSLNAFDLVVVSHGSGTATLNWNAPTQNTDDSALTDLAGYRISYGSRSDQLDHSIRINSAGVTTYMFTDLGAGTWYFVVRAINSQSIESDVSNTANKPIM